MSRYKESRTERIVKTLCEGCPACLGLGYNFGWHVVSVEPSDPDYWCAGCKDRSDYLEAIEGDEP